MKRCELTDEQRGLVEPLLPHKLCGPFTVDIDLGLFDRKES